MGSGDKAGKSACLITTDIIVIQQGANFDCCAHACAHPLAARIGTAVALPPFVELLWPCSRLIRVATHSKNQ